jgi:hypothetical protein
VISNEKLNQMARLYAEQFDVGTREHAEEDYVSGFRAAEKMILDEASEGCADWLRSQYPGSYLGHGISEDISGDAWAAAVLSERKKSDARIRQLEWDLDAAENNQTEYILTILYRCEKLEAAVRDMAQALVYYGAPSSWCHKGAHGGSSGSRYRILPEDREPLSGWDEGLVVGGKTARTALEKHRALIEALKGEYAKKNNTQASRAFN